MTIMTNCELQCDRSSLNGGDDAHAPASPVLEKSPEIPETLLEREQVIEKGAETFIEVGLALAQIRDMKLYEHRGYATFEAYRKTHLGFDRSHAWRLCSTALLATEIKGQTGAAITPSHIRALLPAVKRTAKKGPDCSLAIRLYIEAEKEMHGRMTAGILKMRVRDAVKKGSPKKATNAEGQRPRSIPEPSTREEVSPAPPPPQERSGDTHEVVFQEGHDGELINFLRTCDDELVRCLSEIIDRTPDALIVFTDDRRDAVWKAYRCLQAGLKILDPTHRPKLPDRGR